MRVGGGHLSQGRMVQEIFPHSLARHGRDARAREAIGETVVDLQRATVQQSHAREDRSLDLRFAGRGGTYRESHRDHSQIQQEGSRPESGRSPAVRGTQSATGLGLGEYGVSFPRGSQQGYAQITYCYIASQLAFTT